MTCPGITFPRAPDSFRHLKRYLKFISTRPERDLVKELGYHLHHIIPKCMKGTDDPFNLIKLSYREHYLAHCLLYQAFPSDKRLGKAINCFKSSAKNSRVFQLNAHHEHTQSTRDKIGISNKGKPRPRKVPMSTQERLERAKRCKNREWSEESKQKLRKNSLDKPTIHFALAVANRPDRDRTGINNSRGNKEVWNNEDTLRSAWIENGKCGARKLYSITKIGRTWQSLRAIIKKFRKDDDIV